MAKYELNERQRRFADNVLQGMSQREAYIEAGYKSRGARADSNASNLMRKSKVQAYLAERREKLQDVALVEAKDVVEELTKRAFWDPIVFAGVEMKGPEDFGNLPEGARALVKGWKYDQHGNFVLELVDKDRALIELGKVFGIYQADAQNWRDKKENLLKDLFWRWVVSHHLATGKSVPELATYGKAHPEEVQAWGREVGFLESGDDPA